MALHGVPRINDHAGKSYTLNCPILTVCFVKQSNKTVTALVVPNIYLHDLHNLLFLCRALLILTNSVTRNTEEFGGKCDYLKNNNGVCLRQWPLAFLFVVQDV